MTSRTLAMVTNYHKERRVGRKTAAFIAAVHAHLRTRGIDLNVEFVLDRPDEATHRHIEQAAAPMGEAARIHMVEFGNLGLSRTFGVGQARGDVVCFVDGDDFFSMNWFEGALDYLSRGPLREVIHTQYLVGFDHEEYVRETLRSDHPSFDPLSLAVDWYWNGNLAIQTDVFAAMPIQPYDHAGGFGSEDWHWACNCAAAGIARASLPGTTYYYRVKPERFSLGQVADVIHMASPLFTRAGAPPPPAKPTPDPIPVEPLTAEFFAQAREMEKFEIGVSYLRSVEAGGQTVRHFSPHTPPIVGSVLRAVLEAGFDSGSTIVFADAQRLAGGLPAAQAMGDALTGPGGAPRLYIVEGDAGPSHPCPDGYAISLAALRAAGLYDAQIDRLVARFFVQFDAITVVNLLSPRMRSCALAYSRATRGSVKAWINVVMEYGYDPFSQAYDEMDLFAVAGIESRNVALFEKTAEEAGRLRGVALLWDEGLEGDYVAGTLGSRLRAPDAEAPASDQAPPPSAESRTFRITGESLAGDGAERDEAPAVTVTERLRALAQGEGECIFAIGDTFLGARLDEDPLARLPGVRIPALTVIAQEGQPTLYLRHPVEAFNQVLASGRFPADIMAAGAIGFDRASLRDALARFPDRLPLSDLFETCLQRARAGGHTCVDVFDSAGVVSVTAADLDLIDKAFLARTLGARWAGEAARE